MALVKTGSQIGRRLKEARERADLTQKQAAGEVGIDSLTLSRWELGKQPPRMNVVVRLAALYQTTVAELSGERLVENVPRATQGTVAIEQREGKDPLRDLRLTQNDVERVLIEAGASEAVVADTARRFVELSRIVRDRLAHARAGTLPETVAEPPLDPAEIGTFIAEEMAHSRAHDAKPTGRAAAKKASGGARGPGRAR